MMRMGLAGLRGLAAAGLLAAAWSAFPAESGGSAPVPAQHDPPPVQEAFTLFEGASKTLSFPHDIRNVTVADPETADVELLDHRRLSLIGHQVGHTTLEVFGDAGRVLGGYSVNVTANPQSVHELVAQIAGADTDIEVQTLGNALVVSGTAKSAAEAELLLRGIRAVTGDKPLVEAISLKQPPQVNLEVVISEVSHSVSNVLGINWSLDHNPFLHPLRTFATGGTMLGTGSQTLGPYYTDSFEFSDGLTIDRPSLGVASPDDRGGRGGIVLAHAEVINSDEQVATAFLEALAENGLAVIHARPNLTAISGQSADFFSGLEIPIPVVSDFGNVGTEYRETGVSLRFTPTVLDNQQISLTVAPRIREVTTGGTMIAGALVPNINERSAQTTVELGDGESIAIAGLYRRNTRSANSGVPLLKDIPLWGALFRNTEERNESVELIIVATPRIVRALPSASALAGIKAPGSSPQQLENEYYY